MYAGIEGRGTRFTVLLGRSPGEVAERFDVPATGPAETLGAVTRFIAERAGDDLRGVGIACFGPLDYARGTVTYTLKPGWQDFPIVGTVRDALRVPVVLDTDVNAAAVAEGATRGIEDLLFVTIGSGTGIGAGALVAGAPVHGRSHPEMGHLPVRRHPDDPLEGLCPYHRDCLEGLATAKAMATRWGVPAEESPAEGIALEAFYLAQLVAAATYMLSPQLVVVDGALAAVPSLIPAVREAVDARLAGDPAVRAITEDLTDYIQPSALDGDAAALGALRLAAPPAPEEEEPMHTIQNLIDGTWQPATSGETIARENPAKRTEIIAESPASDAGDVDRAVQAARQAWPAWAALPLSERVDLIRRGLAILEERKDDLAVADVLESGKVKSDCEGEIFRALSATNWQLDEAPRVLTAQRTLDNGMDVLLEHAPVGVAALITPWNYPVSAVVRKSVPALVAGNTVVLKPSELTPITAQIIGEAFTDAGLPAGVFNIVHGAGQVVGQSLVDHPGIGAISFTGSARVGLQLQGAIGSRDVKLQVEMGGKNPLVVLEDADLEAAVDAAVSASFTAAGQWCIATSRIIVEDGVYDEFASRLAARANAVKVGDGLDPASEMGPVSSQVQYDKVLSYFGPDKFSGTVLAGGGPVEGADGYYIQPTVIVGPDPASAVVQEEIFGPVVSVLPAKDLDEAIALSNGTDYGLCAAIFTKDRDAALRYARAVDAGRVGVNTPTSIGDQTVPGGGRKNSGRGEYEGAEAGILFFTHLKPIFVNL